MSAVSLKIKKDVEFYTDLYDEYKHTPSMAKSTELAKTMREVIAGLKKLQRMH